MSRSMLIRLSALAATAALFGAGCTLPLNPQTAPPTTTEKPAAAPAATSKTKAVVPHTSTITIINKAFSPLVLAITTGDTIVWTNKDSMSHTTVSDNALIWDSGNIAPSASYKRVFSSPGTYTYHCGIHPEMKGTIIVRDPVVK